MKLKKMLHKMMVFFDADLKQQRKELTSLRKMLKGLKLKEQDLLAELDETDEVEKQESLQNKLDVVRAQRAKGKQYLLALRADRDPNQADGSPLSDQNVTDDKRTK